MITREEEVVAVVVEEAAGKRISIVVVLYKDLMIKAMEITSTTKSQALTSHGYSGSCAICGA